MSGYALVAQSGGPSPVINASLQGVADACAEATEISGVFAAHHGIEGVLLENLIDLGAQDRAEIARLRYTPSAAAGTCRYKLTEDRASDFRRIVDVFAAHNIRYFFYIGGNDSMDTADKVGRLADSLGYDLKVIGVPKTIDNDLGDEARTIIDHTPGYGSCARYWANLIRVINEENRAMCPSECVSVLQAMGRDTGFITAAARLGDPQREMPLQLYLPESHIGADELCEKVNEGLRRHGRVIVVVSESFMADEGSARYDGFGHVEYGASRTTAMQTVLNLLNGRGMCVRGQATGQVPGALQRCQSLEVSSVDRDEAYTLGRKAVEYAVSGETGQMATILRVCDAPYRARYGTVPLSLVANAARHLPKDWIAPSGIDVMDDFIRYAMPLIGDACQSRTETEGGLARYARLSYEYIEKKLPAYCPCGFESAIEGGKQHVS